LNQKYFALNEAEIALINPVGFDEGKYRMPVATKK
tara:strand:+ start:449 stop:553 length:105 start_codon:yes stop_codon:yes gene_type:complete